MAERPELLILRGLPCAGKTTWALERVAKGHGPRRWVRVATNELRILMHGREMAWSKDRDDLATGLRDQMIASALKAGFNVVADDWNLDPGVVDHLRNLGEMMGATVAERRFEVTLEDALWRNAHRQHPVRDDLILTLHRSYGKTREDVRFQYRAPRPDLPPAIICDLDGTLAILANRSYNEPDLCGTDVVNQPVLQVLHALLLQISLGRDYKERCGEVIFVSGRPERTRGATMEWLLAAGFYSNRAGLLLRADGDDRSEAIIKRELFEQHIDGKYDVRYVLDDRDRPVAMWRSLGLCCLQTAFGSF